MRRAVVCRGLVGCGMVSGVALGQVCDDEDLNRSLQEVIDGSTLRVEYTTSGDADCDEPTSDYFSTAQAQLLLDQWVSAFEAFDDMGFTPPFQNDYEAGGPLLAYIRAPEPGEDEDGNVTYTGNSYARADCIRFNAWNYRCDDVTSLRRVATHELFHLIQRRYCCPVLDCTDDGLSPTYGKWTIEATARLAEDYVFPDVDVAENTPYYGDVTSSTGPLRAPEIGLLGLDYKSCLFWKYCCEQYGGVQEFSFVRTLWQQYQGLASSSGITVADRAILLHGGEGFLETFLDYVACNVAKDLDRSLMDEPDRYGYADEAEHANGYGPAARTSFGGSSYAQHVDRQAPLSMRYWEWDPSTSECVAMGMIGESENAILGWVVLGVDRNDRVVSLSKGYDTTFGRTMIKGGTSEIDRMIVGVATLGWGSDYDLTFESGSLRLDVRQPSAALGAYPGPATQPGRVLVRVLAEGPAALEPPGVGERSVQGLEASDFEVEIGGVRAPVFSADEVGGEYWLVVDAPQQPADGDYDLEVSICDGVSQRVSNAVHYGEIVVNHAVVMDVSGSMDQPSGTSKLDAAKIASQLYVDAVGEDDGIGFVYFSGNGTECNEDGTILRNVTTATAGQRDVLKFFISALGSLARTSVGDGIWRAQNSIEASPVAADERRMVLLTDGVENEQRYWATPNPCDGGTTVADRLVPTSTAIHSIAFGEDADLDLLTEISESTGGVSSFVTVTGDERASSSLPIKLSDVFVDQLAASDGSQRVFELSGEIDGSREFEIPITESFLSKVRFMVFVDSEAAGLTTTLHDPSGAEVPASAAPLLDEDTHAVYHLRRSPEVGTWSVKVQTATSAQFRIVVLGKQRFGAMMHLGFTQHRTGGLFGDFDASFEQGVPVRISALLTDGLGPIRDAHVAIDVRHPDGSDGCMSPVMKDDGGLGDRRADDGVYGAWCTRTSQAGSLGRNNDNDNPKDPPPPPPQGGYIVRVEASGTNNFGEPFTVIETRTFQVEPSTDRDGDTLPDTWEVWYGSDPQGHDPGRDDDEDLLTNLEEFEAGTDPFMADTDGDGEIDGSEVGLGRCPVDASDVGVRAPIDVEVVTTDDEDHPSYRLPETNRLRFPWEPGYEKLRIERAVGTPSSFSFLTTLDVASGPRGTWDDVGLEAGVTYYYRFRALGANGAISAWSRPVAGTPTALCIADLTGDTILDIFDVVEFLGLFDARDPVSDWNGDGEYDIFDVLEYLGAFTAGC